MKTIEEIHQLAKQAATDIITWFLDGYKKGDNYVTDRIERLVVTMVNETEEADDKFMADSLAVQHLMFIEKLQSTLDACGIEEEKKERIIQLMKP